LYRADVNFTSSL